MLQCSSLLTPLAITIQALICTNTKTLSQSPTKEPQSDDDDGDNDDRAPTTKQEHLPDKDEDQFHYLHPH